MLVVGERQSASEPNTLRMCCKMRFCVGLLLLTLLGTMSGSFYFILRFYSLGIQLPKMPSGPCLVVRDAVKCSPWFHYALKPLILKRRVAAGGVAAVFLFETEIVLVLAVMFKALLFDHSVNSIAGIIRKHKQ